MKTRKAAHASRFYPSNVKDLTKLYHTILKTEQKNINYQLAESNLIGAIVPHAAYVYSGYQAIHVFEILKSSSKKFDTFFIINPNHSGLGPSIAFDTNEAWETPFGDVQLDLDLMRIMDFPQSEAAHQSEHSAEIMLPFLKYALDYDFKIVPITLSEQNKSNAQILASSIHKVVQESHKNTFFIASSDFSHFLSPKRGQELDDFVLNEIYELNSLGIEQEVNSKNITVCGFGPIMSLIEYAKMQTINPQISLLRRGHSGEVHPSIEVVNYISILFSS